MQSDCDATLQTGMLQLSGCTDSCRGLRPLDTHICMHTAHLMHTAAPMLHTSHSLLHLYLVHPAGFALLYEGISKLMEALSSNCIDPRPHLTYNTEMTQMSYCANCFT